MALDPKPGTVQHVRKALYDAQRAFENLCAPMPATSDETLDAAARAIGISPSELLAEVKKILEPPLGITSPEKIRETLSPANKESCLLRSLAIFLPERLSRRLQQSFAKHNNDPESFLTAVFDSYYADRAPSPPPPPAPDHEVLSDTLVASLPDSHQEEFRRLKEKAHYSSAGLVRTALIEKLQGPQDWNWDPEKTGQRFFASCPLKVQAALEKKRADRKESYFVYIRGALVRDLLEDKPPEPLGLPLEASAYRVALALPFEAFKKYVSAKTLNSWSDKVLVLRALESFLARTSGIIEEGPEATREVFDQINPRPAQKFRRAEDVTVSGSLIRGLYDALRADPTTLLAQTLRDSKECDSPQFFARVVMVNAIHKLENVSRARGEHINVQPLKDFLEGRDYLSLRIDREAGGGRWSAGLMHSPGVPYYGAPPEVEHVLNEVASFVGSWFDAK